MNDIARLSTDPWQDAAERLMELREKESLTEEEAGQLLNWLEETQFDNDWFSVGQIAAGLLREKPRDALKSRVRTLCEDAEGWQLYFFLMVLQDETDHADLQRHALRAMQAKEMTIKLFGAELQGRWATATTP